MSKNNRSDDFDTMSFEPIRPGNPNYDQYFNKPIDTGDLSEFEDEPAAPPARNGFDQLAEESFDEPYKNYSIDEDYYGSEPANDYDGLVKGAIIAIAAIMGSIIIAVIIMFAVMKSGESNTPNSPIPYTTSTTTTTVTTEATTSQVSTTQATTSTTEETSSTTTETETTSTTEATTTEATTEAATTTEAVTTTEAPTTQPPTTTQATTEPTEAPTTTEAQPISTSEAYPGQGIGVVDLDPEIPGIQSP